MRPRSPVAAAGGTSTDRHELLRCDASRATFRRYVPASTVAEAVGGSPVTALLLASVAVLVALNGFFVGAEFALVRARRSRVESLQRAGTRGAGLALKQIDRIDQYLAACQLGITMASLGIGFLGEPAIARLLEGPLGSVFGHAVAVAVSIAIAYLIVTAAHITVGEQVPKIYAITHPEASARWVAAPLEWFFVASKPLTWFLNSVSNGMLRVIGTDPRADMHEDASEEELRLLISESAVGGVLQRSEAEMLSGVFQLHEQQARRVMTPFHAVVKVPRDADARTALERCIESGHTRLVVVDPDRPEHVAGIVHTNSLVHLLLTAGEHAPIDSAMKPIPIVPETKPIDDLLADLQRERLTLALVADEYGTPVGIVTMEDILEEIVGEIVDETDPALAPVRRLSNGDWYIRADTSLDDLVHEGIDLPVSPNYDSVGGLILETLRRLPVTGDIVLVNGYSLRVESVRGTRIEAVRLRDHDGRGGGAAGQPAA
jgi:CBS domain containing-hemolysin-like protein